MIEEISNITVRDPYEGLSVLDIKRLQYPLWAHVIAGVYLMFVGIFGFIENVLVLITFGKNKALRSPTNVFIMGVSVSDLLMVTLAIQISAMNSMNGKWWVGDFLCYFEGFIVYALGLASLYLLTAVSIDRYIVISKPLLAPLITKRVASLAVLGCFGGGIFWAIFPFFGWSSYGLESAGVFCGLHYGEKSFSNMSYIAAIFIFTFVLPMGAMIYCYTKIYLTVKSVGRNCVWDMKSRVARKNLRIEKKMLKSCVLMCAVFWCSWTPYAVTSFWEAFGDGNQIPIFLYALPAIAAKSQVLWNPIIYVATNKQFRRGFYSVLPCTELRKSLEKKEELADKEPSSEGTDTEADKKGAAPAQDETNGNPNPIAVAPAPGEPTKVEC